MTRKEMEQKLRWWLDFLQTDIDALPEKEKSHLHLEFSFYFDPWVSTVRLPAGWWYPPETLKMVQTTVKEFLDKTLRMADHRGKGSVEMIPLPVQSRQLEISDDYQFKITFPHLFYPDKYKKGSSKKPVLEKDWIINDFSRLLEGISIDAIKKCLTCDKLFLHLSKKEKKYCSPKCSYKFLSRKRREEIKKHPKKYRAFLKKQREVMRHSYEEKRRAILGPNVKIKRNGKREV